MSRKKILILCTGNTCRSQMAQGWLASFDEKLEVFSAGTKPEKNVNPFAVKVMKEAGIDISRNTPQDVRNFIAQEWDLVLTVCDQAHEVCPVFQGKVKKRMHEGFEDPSDARGSEEYIYSEYIRIRDEIKLKLKEIYEKVLLSS